MEVEFCALSITVRICFILKDSRLRGGGQAHHKGSNWEVMSLLSPIIITVRFRIYIITVSESRIAPFYEEEVYDLSEKNCGGKRG